ncbi:hypothetical protein FV139_00125 [Parahaliea maris]|uniref:DUF4760 domain-containing protein n=1 Tax=Parahaliea maris TaxID=2716870 RepID=A0A5C9A5E5_9GAMM|nr:hypothetical protein [Parahaliea maris]TXS95956.1 hypothetical protein FV139_00125 [Parahaliea maris]
MDWEALGASAELIGAVAIFISLVYLGVQIRQNTQMIASNMEATRLAAFERNVESGNRSRELMLLYPELGELFLKGCKDLDALDGKERFRFVLLLRNLFSSIQGAYIRQLTLSHDPEEFAGSARVIDELVANPGVRQYIERSDPDWRPEFRALVEERLKMV